MTPHVAAATTHEEAQHEFMRVLRKVGLVCHDIDETTVYESLEAGWKETSIENMWLLIGLFQKDEAVIQQMKAEYYAIPAEFAEKAQEKYLQTGKPTVFSKDKVREEQRKVLLSFEPSVRKLIKKAENLIACAAREAARELAREIPEEKWEKKPKPEIKPGLEEDRGRGNPKDNRS